MTIRAARLACAVAALAAVTIGHGVMAAPQPAPSATPPAAPSAPAPDMARLADEALSHLGARLKLTDDQAGKIQPLLTAHLAGVREMFMDYSDPGGGQLPALMQEFRERRDRFRTSLEPILTPPQMQEFEVIRKEVDGSLRDTICDERLAILKARLSLTADQEARLRPILREDWRRTRCTVTSCAPRPRSAPSVLSLTLLYNA